MSESIAWQDYSNGTLLTTPQVAELITQTTGKSLKPSTWRYYQSKWGSEGLIPPPIRYVGPAALYDQGQVLHWATHRMGRGYRRDLPQSED